MTNLAFALALPSAMVLLFIVLYAALAIAERVVPGLSEWLDKNVEPPSGKPW